MKRLGSWVLAAILATAGGDVAANTIRVPSDRPSIQAGINAAQTGDSVLVAPGTYTENIDFQGKAIVVTTESGASGTELLPSDPIKVTVNMNLKVPAGGELSGFTITGGSGLDAVKIGNESVSVIKNNVFRDFQSVLYNAVMISCRSSSPIISHNVFYNNGGVSCVGVFSGTAIIDHNTFDSNRRGFFSLSGVGTATNNIVTNSTEYGIAGTFSANDYNCVWNNNPDYTFGASAGPHSISADPLYCQPPVDYSLSGISPCLGTGEGPSNMGALAFGCGIPVPVVTVTIGPSDDLSHILDNTPEIAWTYYDPQDLPLVESEIEVGTDSDWAAAEMWQSGGIAGPTTTVEYAGLPLSDGATYWLRLRAYNGDSWSTWSEHSFHMNAPPSAPVPVSPVGHEILPQNCTALTVTNSTDTEGDNLTYDFELYSDAGLTVPVETQEQLAEQPSSTVSDAIIGLSASTDYWWRARAYDGFEYSDWSATETFTNASGNQLIRVPTDQPAIQAAINMVVCIGDTVLVEPGTYTENIDFGGKTVILMSSMGAEVTILTPSDPSIPTIALTAGEGPQTELNGFTIAGGEAATVVDIDNGAAPVIHNNIFYGHAHSGVGGGVSIVCNDSDPLITHNVFYDNTTGGCIGISTGSARILNNTMDNNYLGVWSVTPAGVIKNNIITNCSVYGIHTVYSETEIDYNCLYNNTSDYDGCAFQGVHTIIADPMYCDAGAHNYSLAASSPCAGSADDGSNRGALAGATCDPVNLNSIVVGSKWTGTNETNVTIPVFLQNDVSLSSLAIPLVIRETSPGSFITSLTMSYSDRLAPGGPLGDLSLTYQYPMPDGGCRTGGFGTAGSADFVSPDGVVFERARTISGALAPGVDATGSMILTVDIGGTMGGFEIDTTCIDPGTHLLLVEDGTGAPILPAFTKGTVSIGFPYDHAGVTVESKSIETGTVVTIGVYLTNNVAVAGLVIPLAIREVTPGVYPQMITGYYPAGSRLSGTLDYLIAINGFDVETGYCNAAPNVGFILVEGGISGNEDIAYTLSSPDSPDALLFTRNGHCADVLNAGTDGSIPSLAIDIVAPNTVGTFIIDTTCIAPTGHLSFRMPDNSAVEGMTFTAGVIEVTQGACNCPYQADFDGDSFLTSLDLGELIDELWASHPLLKDYTCATARGDLDCDGFATALDLSVLIDLLYSGGAGPCDPCL